MGHTREAFEDNLYDIWARYFECPSEIFRDSGLTIQPQDNLLGTGMVNLYRIGKQLIARCDDNVQNTLIDMMQNTILRKGLEHGMTEADIQSEVMSQFDKTLEGEHLEWLFYLYPTDFKPYTSPDFDLRQLSATDKGSLDDLKSACTPDDVDEGWVHVTDELVYGAFDGDKMVACASLFDWRGFGDPGVLVHPKYRQKGLGKAVVSPICAFVLEQGRVMDYRCDAKNLGSAGIAKSLGFTRYFEIEVFKLVDKA